MSVAEKLQQIADNQPRVYEAGRRDEQQDFWDCIQNKGGLANYTYAFCYSRFDEKTYNPKYDIRCTQDTDSSSQGVFRGSILTDTKVGIYAGNRNMTNCFQNSDLKTIRLLYVYDTTAFSSTFSGCANLENITFGGTIGQNISFSSSEKLTHDSLMSIIEHLGTVSSTRTLTLGSKNLAKLTDAEKAIATEKGWSLA